MRKHISFAIAATILGLAMIFWFKASMVEINANVARQTADLVVADGQNHTVRSRYSTWFIK